jgi:hypothetical protein
MNYVSKKPTCLAISFMAAMKARDDLPGRDLTADKVLAHLQNAVQFCWAAHQNLIPVMCYTVGSRDARISAWVAVLHMAHIMPF